MLSLRIENLGDVTIIHCAGRIAFPDARELRITLVRQLRIRTLVLDLADTVAIDAAGLGVLVSLRVWAKQTGRVLKLMNVTPWVEWLLQLTKLKSEFEICTAREMLDLLCRSIHQSGSVAPETAVENPDFSSRSHALLQRQSHKQDGHAFFRIQNTCPPL
jgi:anti-anti-sigma factor